MYINYDYYRIFFYVAKYRSFTRAANALINNQPNVTRTIKKLESELGCTLFIRSNRGVRLTPEGERLYEHVRIAVEQIQAGEEELAMEKGLESGTVSVGASEVALRSFLLPVLKEYRRHYPKVKLRIANYSTLQAISALKSGAADIALVTTPTGEQQTLKIRNVKEIQETAVCGTAFSQLWGRTVSLKEIAEFPIISLGKHTKTYEIYTNWFLQHGVEFKPDIEAATADQILPMVKNNLGIGFIPQDFLSEESGPGVVRLELEERLPKRAVCLIKRENQTLSIAAKELERMILCRRAVP